MRGPNTVLHLSAISTVFSTAFGNVETSSELRPMARPSDCRALAASSISHRSCSGNRYFADTCPGGRQGHRFVGRLFPVGLVRDLVALRLAVRVVSCRVGIPPSGSAMSLLLLRAEIGAACF